MYDAQRFRQLENRSHVRGALTKEFYSDEHAEKERKRQEMKRILDQQVEEKRRRQAKEASGRNSSQGIYGTGNNAVSHPNNSIPSHANSHSVASHLNASIKQHGSLVYQPIITLGNQPLIAQSQQYGNQPLMMPSHNSKSHLQPSGYDEHSEQFGRQQAQSKSKMQSNVLVDAGNIPVMSLMPHQHIKQYTFSDETIRSKKDSIVQMPIVSAGNIPLLDLGDDPRNSRGRRISNSTKQRQPTKRSPSQSPMTGSHPVEAQFNGGYHNGDTQQLNGSNVVSMNPVASMSAMNGSGLNNQQFYGIQSLMPLAGQSQVHASYSTAPTLLQANMMGHGGTSGHAPLDSKRMTTQGTIPQSSQQFVGYRDENSRLKKELRRNQQAFSLLLGAARTNPKMDKWRVQAQRILHSGDIEVKEDKDDNGRQSGAYKSVSKQDQSNEESGLALLPRLKITHQSIMHDYLLGMKKGNVKPQK